MKPFEIVSSLIVQIEKGSHEKLTIRDLAMQYHVSDVHLQRIFKFVFGTPLAGYIRSRRLALSIERLLDTNLRIIDVAFDSGFGGERAYIRAFKNEYGISPGEYRKSGGIVKIVPPFTLCDANMLDDGLLYGPDIVQVPHFCVAGRLHAIRFEDLGTPHVVAREFEQYMSGMPCVVDPNIYWTNPY